MRVINRRFTDIINGTTLPLSGSRQSQRECGLKPSKAERSSVNGEWRLKRGTSQEELAWKADVPTASVSHFETRHRFPNAATLRRLADALGASADCLLGRAKDPVGEDLEAAHPEIAVLFRRFQECRRRRASK